MSDAMETEGGRDDCGGFAATAPLPLAATMTNGGGAEAEAEADAAMTMEATAAAAGTGHPRETTREVPVATPASGGEHARDDLASRIARSFPPLPLMQAGGFDRSSKAHAVATAANHVSPATPMPPPVAIAYMARGSAGAGRSIGGIAGGSGPSSGATPSTPASGRSQKSALAALYRSGNRPSSRATPATPASGQSQKSALAALYQSSRRRSRTNTPGSQDGMPPPAPANFPPPPPLYSAREDSLRESLPKAAAWGESSLGGLGSGLESSSGEGGLGGGLEGSADAAPPPLRDNEAHKVSLQSSVAPSHAASVTLLRDSELLHESWNTSMSSLMNSTSSYMNASFVKASLARTHGSLGLSSGSGSPFKESMCEDDGGGGAGAGASEAEPTSARASSLAQRSGSKFRPNLVEYKIEDRTSNRSVLGEFRSASDSTDETFQRGDSRESQVSQGSAHANDGAAQRATLPTVPTFSGDSADVRADAAALHAAQRDRDECLTRLSHLRVRSRVDYERHGSDSTRDDSKDGADDGRGKRGSDPSCDPEGEGTEQEMEGAPPRKRNRNQPRPGFLSSRELSAPSLPPPSSLPPPPPPPPSVEDCYLTPVTFKTAQSFDIYAQPSSRVSSIYDPDVSPDSDEVMKPSIRDVDLGDLTPSAEDVAELRAGGVDAGTDHAAGHERMALEAQATEARPRAADRGGAPMQGAEDRPPDRPPLEVVSEDPMQAVMTDGSGRRSLGEKEARILRRKIQRLLLIRHCSTCPFLPPAPDDETTDEGSVVWTCPRTSHCARGKALCAHIRTCRDERCGYKWCLTSRDVLGHYKSCRDAQCAVCGPVRALDRDEARRRHRRRASDDSSIETIDDAGWLADSLEEEKGEGAGRPSPPIAGLCPERADGGFPAAA